MTTRIQYDIYNFPKTSGQFHSFSFKTALSNYKSPKSTQFSYKHKLYAYLRERDWRIKLKQCQGQQGQLTNFSGGVTHFDNFLEEK